MQNKKDGMGIPQKAFTHSGMFHADDVFSAALLRLLNPEIEIERGSCIPEGYEGLVFDIGGGAFDHHQKDSEVRKNGIPYASFGKLWRYFGRRLVAETYVQEFDEQFVQKVDLSDNSQETDTISIAVRGFYPLWNEQKRMEDAFWEAVAFAEGVLCRQMKKYKSKKSAEELVLKEAEKARDGILILEKYIPYGSVLEDTDIRFVIFPSIRGGYGINNINNKDGSKKVDFPPEWLGSKDESIGLMFCHKGNFTAAADTLEHAVDIAKTAVDRMEKRKENKGK